MNVVVDTNLVYVADGRHDRAQQECVSACIRALRDAEDGVVCIDGGGRIMVEYLRGVGPYPYEPGTAFVRQLEQRQWDPQRCERIDVHEHPERGFEEFPDDPALASFDLSDRKFVAVAIASCFDPPILNASDTDWWPVREHLARNGVRVQFLCPELMH